MRKKPQDNSMGRKKTSSLNQVIFALVVLAAGYSTLNICQTPKVNHNIGSNDFQSLPEQLQKGLVQAEGQQQRQQPQQHQQQPKTPDEPAQTNSTPQQTQQQVDIQPANRKEIITQIIKAGNGAPVANRVPQKEVPVVIICALRPAYLEQVLESLQVQLPKTPSWIADSPRYLFVHKHPNNHVGNNFALVKEMAEKHNFTLQVFQGLHFPNEKMNTNANFAWYRMMSFLFHKLNVMEALILEDDAVLAPDALMVAAALFQEKWKRTDVHATVLGSWSGTNRVLANPYTIQASRCRFFQAMAYSMDAVMFTYIEEKKKEQWLYNEVFIPDWTEEITASRFVENLTQLTPSVGRMKHIGAMGMGGKGLGVNTKSGKAKANRNITEGVAWSLFNKTIMNTSKTVDDFYLDPPEVTDRFGFICEPLRFDCLFVDQYHHLRATLNSLGNGFGVKRKRKTNLPSELRGTVVRPADAAASSMSSQQYFARRAIDNNLFTRWKSNPDLVTVPQWLIVDMGKIITFSSIVIHWEYHAIAYRIEVSDSRSNWRKAYEVSNSTGYIEYIDMSNQSGRYIRLSNLKPSKHKDFYSVWEVQVRKQ